MTRQQRRKMERDIKKRNKNKIENQLTIYSSSIVYIESLNKTVKVIGSFTHPEDISKVDRNNTVYETGYLVDIENNGVSTTSIVRIIHNSKKCMYENDFSKNLMMNVVSDLIQSNKNDTRETLNVNTKFKNTLCKSSEIFPQVLYKLEDYGLFTSIGDQKLVSDMYQEFDKVG